ncbi:MAG TPA: biotin/lipoyl-binding protein, partial [Alphaproteobacteria bacterium]|nr:biotin/lipoyl-binding protein [Alphaproteobacteria bacterium]
MKRNSSRISPPILALATVLPFLFACNGQKVAETSVTVQATQAAKASISRVVSVEAVVFPVLQSAVTPKINAPVRKFYVTRGQRVHRGQLLAVLENRDLSAAAMDNQGAFEQAQAAYKTNVGATLPEDTQKAELDTQTAKQALDAEQKLYDSRENLFNQGALPRKDLDQARVSLIQARSAYEIARKHLDGLNALVKAQALKAASGQLTSAQGKMLGAQAQLSYS